MRSAIKTSSGTVLRNQQEESCCSTNNGVGAKPSALMANLAFQSNRRREQESNSKLDKLAETLSRQVWRLACSHSSEFLRKWNRKCRSIQCHPIGRPIPVNFSRQRPWDEVRRRLMPMSVQVIKDYLCDQSRGSQGAGFAAQRRNL